jgi:hypothetical protein
VKGPCHLCPGGQWSALGTVHGTSRSHSPDGLADGLVSFLGLPGLFWSLWGGVVAVLLVVVVKVVVVVVAVVAVAVVVAGAVAS